MPAYLEKWVADRDRKITSTRDRYRNADPQRRVSSDPAAYGEPITFPEERDFQNPTSG